MYNNLLNKQLIRAVMDIFYNNFITVTIVIEVEVIAKREKVN